VTGCSPLLLTQQLAPIRLFPVPPLSSPRTESFTDTLSPSAEVFFFSHTYWHCPPSRPAVLPRDHRSFSPTPFFPEDNAFQVPSRLLESLQVATFSYPLFSLRRPLVHYAHSPQKGFYSFSIPSIPEEFTLLQNKIFRFKAPPLSPPCLTPSSTLLLIDAQSPKSYKKLFPPGSSAPSS